MRRHRRKRFAFTDFLLVFFLVALASLTDIPLSPPQGQMQPPASAKVSVNQSAAQSTKPRVVKSHATASPTITKTPHFRVRISAYNPSRGQTDSTPWLTAACTRARPGIVAVSRDLLKHMPYGTRLKILHPKFRGQVFVVEDTMGASRRRQIDVLMLSRERAWRWGVRAAEVRLLPGNAKLVRVPCR